MQELAARLGIVGELFQFLWKRKLYWLIPMVITLLVFAFLILMSASSPLAPFIYSIF